MNILKLIVLGFILNSAFATDLVFMSENKDGKVIMLQNKNGELKQLTDNKLWNLYPDISPDGRYVSFVSGENEKSLNLFVLDRNSNQLEKWDVGEGLVLHTRFSRNAKRLYFSAPLGKDGINQIAYIDLEKERLTGHHKLMNNVHLFYPKINIIKDDKTSFFPSPTTDSTFIAYQRNKSEKQREIVLYNVEEKKHLIIDEGMSPSFSKDDRYVAYTKKVDGNWDIYTYDRFTKKIERKTFDLKFDFAPTFDRIGNLIFASNRNGEFSIYKKNFNSPDGRSNPELVSTKKDTSLYSPKISGIKNIDLKLSAPIIGKPRSSFGAIEHLGKVYVVGGHQGKEHTYPPESFTNRVTVYDRSTNEWSLIAPRIYPCHGFQLAAKGKYIYAFGGFAYEETNLPKWKSLDVVERYDIEKNKWEVVAKMPRRRSSNIVLQSGNKAYLIGGWDSTPKFDNDLDGTFHSEIDVFDFSNNSFEVLSVELPKKRRAFSGVVSEDKFYLVGGISEGADHFSLLDNITEFNPKTLEFKEIGKLPYPTFAPAAGVLNNKLYVFGGMFKTGKWSYEYVTQIYQYDFHKSSWENTGRFLNESKGFSQVVKYENKLGILGGHTYMDGADAPVPTFEVFSLK